MLSKHNAQGGRSYATPVDQAVQKEYAFEVRVAHSPADTVDTNH